MPSGSQFQDTNLLNTSYVPMLGTTVNNTNINIDPPSLPPHLRGYPQPATNQFNFSSGSQATFPIQQNQNFRNLETHQPIHNAPAPVEVEPEGEQAYYAALWELTNLFEDFVDEGDSRSKEFAGEPSVDVNDPQNLSSYLACAQQPSEYTAHLQGTVPASCSDQTSTLTPNTSCLPPPYEHSS